MTDAQVKAALSEFDTYWLTLWAECRAEPVEGQIAVAQVIRTRVRSPKFKQKTYKTVCLAPWQFSCWNAGTDRNHVRLMALASKVVNAETMADDPVMKQLRYVAQGVMAGDLMDNTRAADHYLTADLFNTKPPSWAKGQTPVAVFHDHVFLRL